MTTADLRAYRALDKAPVRSEYRGKDVFGMPVPSSGGIAVGEILNLVEAYDERTGTPTSEVDDVQYLHRFSEASATAFADRNRYVGDVAGVPTTELLSQGFADERSCPFSATATQPRPVPFGSPDGSYGDCAAGGASGTLAHDDVSTTHLSVIDRWGNAVAYTSTIEATGGSGITVPGWGFILNNELTDFNFAPVSPGVPDPNLPGPGKRPRSSMSPTIVLDDGALELVAGSPGGATIITTVAQILLGHYERDLPIGDAVAAPRLSSRNGSSEQAEPAVAAGPVGAGLTALGHRLTSTRRSVPRPPSGCRGATSTRRPPSRRRGAVAGRRWSSGRGADPQDAKALARREALAGHRELGLDPALQAVGAEVALHDEEGLAPRCEPGEPGPQEVVQRRLADPDRGVRPDEVEADVLGHLVGRRRPHRGRSRAAALRRVRSRARSLTSTAQTVAAGERRPRVSATGPHPQPRSRKVPLAGGAGASSRRTAVPLSSPEGENTPPATSTSTSRPARRTRRCGARRRSRGRR